MKILMVCLGNICRSPLAEGIMRKKITDLGLDWRVDSAGTGSWHVGELPDARSIRIAGKYGIDITDQRARQFKPHDLDHFDLVLPMDTSNFRDVMRHAKLPQHEKKVQMIMNFLHPGLNQSVPDPYWDDDGFEKVYQMLNRACDKVVERYVVAVDGGR